VKKFTVKIRHIDQTRAAQINHAIEGAREGGLRGALARSDGKCSAGAAARAGRRMARCAFPGFWGLGVRRIDRLTCSTVGLTAAWRAAGGDRGSAAGGSTAELTTWA
jgi:hypothetical protein